MIITPNYSVKIVKNLGQGSDSIEHLLGRIFPVHSVDEEELCIIHEGSLVPLDKEEYEIV